MRVRLEDTCRVLETHKLIAAQTEARRVDSAAEAYEIRTFKKERCRTGRELTLARLGVCSQHPRTSFRM